MLMRKLIILKYPNYENLDLQDDNEFRKLVIWLEDQKIRHYQIIDRNGLRSITEASWNQHFRKYLKDLKCPFEAGSKEIVVDWLCSSAISLEFKQNRDKNRDCSAETVKKDRESAKSLKNLKVDDASVKDGISKLAKLLNIPQHEDSHMTLQAIRILVQERIQNFKKNASKDSAKKIKVSLAKQELGFETGDGDVDNIARALRLLHINELRQLQTDINEAIVSVQAITANPKTDQSLGRVGRS